VYIQRRFHASRIPHRPYLHNYSCGETLGLGDIDEVVMTVSDAHKWPTITREQLEEAQRYFAGMTSKKPIVEFP
jgi:hypothetical protein